MPCAPDSLACELPDPSPLFVSHLAGVWGHTCVPCSKEGTQTTNLGLPSPQSCLPASHFQFAMRSYSVLVPIPGSENRASCSPGWLQTPYQVRMTLAFRSFCLCLPSTGFIPLPSLDLCGAGVETQGFAHGGRALCEQPCASPDLILFLRVELIVYLSRWRVLSLPQWFVFPNEHTASVFQYSLISTTAGPRSNLCLIHLLPIIPSHEILYSILAALDPEGCATGP